MASQKSLFFGRSIYVPCPGYERVFVISGCTMKNNTNKVCSEVQEWNLEDMTVQLSKPLVPGRTSFSCVHKTGSRHIYVAGGNTEGHITLGDA